MIAREVEYNPGIQERNDLVKHGYLAKMRAALQVLQPVGQVGSQGIVLSSLF